MTDYGYQQYRKSGFKDGEIIDLSDSSWIVANIGEKTNRYPVLIEKSGTNLTIKGGTVTGEVPLDMAWEDAYVNSAAVLVRNAKGYTIRDWRISQAWDGIRLNFDSDGFLIENCHLSEIRDDAIESDDGAAGTIRNCLLDRVFVGISLADEGTPMDAAQEMVVLDGVLCRMQSYLYRSSFTHMPPLKMEANSPQVAAMNCVFAVEKPDHRLDRQRTMWKKMAKSENNFFLNLSDRPFPDGYPLPPAGWTVLQGEEARDYWAKRRAEWLGTPVPSVPPIMAQFHRACGEYEKALLDALKHGKGFLEIDAHGQVTRVEP